MFQPVIMRVLVGELCFTTNQEIQDGRKRVCHVCRPPGGICLSRIELNNKKIENKSKVFVCVQFILSERLLPFFGKRP